MEVSAEGAAVNCFCLTHFGEPSLATVNFPACSSPIGCVWFTQPTWWVTGVQTEATVQTHTEVRKDQEEGKWWFLCLGGLCKQNVTKLAWERHLNPACYHASTHLTNRYMRRRWLQDMVLQAQTLERFNKHFVAHWPLRSLESTAWATSLSSKVCYTSERVKFIAIISCVLLWPDPYEDILQKTRLGWHLSTTTFS